MLINLSVIVSGLLLATHPTDPSLTLLCDARYDLSHGWGHVFRCKVRNVLAGELEDTVVFVSVYGTAKLYGSLLLPFGDYQDLIMVFEYNKNRKYGPPPGFKDSKGNYWELQTVQTATPLSVLPTLSDVRYGFPEWAEFEGKASVYQYTEFPGLKYSQPDPEQWVEQLRPGGTRDSTTGYVQTWQENGKVRFVWVTNPYPDGGRFFSFNGDTIDAATAINTQGALFMTEVGIYKWRYIYSERLLAKIAYYRYNTSSPIWAVDSVKYWPGTDIPRYVYRYSDPDGLDISGRSWDTRTVHNRGGKIIRKENSEGKVLWEKKTTD